MTGQSDAAAERSAHVGRDAADLPAHDTRPWFHVELVSEAGAVVRAWMTRLAPEDRADALTLRIRPAKETAR